MTTNKNNKKNMRKDLWEYNGSIHCAVIGHCLTISEQRKILKKAKYREKKISDSDCHEILTSELSEMTPLSIRIQKYLDAKYIDELKYWDDLLSFEYLNIWLSKIKKPHIGGDFFGLVRQSDILKNDKHSISGSIHVLAYNKVQYYESRSELNHHETIIDLKKELNELQTKVKHDSYQIKMMERESIKIEKRNKTQKKEIEKYITQILNTKEIKNENETLKLKLNKLNNRNTDIENFKEKSRKIWEGQEEKISDQTKVIDALNKELYQITASNDENGLECEFCENSTLCQKRILIVGGLSKLKGYYKTAIENLDGIFDHNDGYGRNGDLALKESIRKADIVLCPVDVNSHNACLSVKKHCKKMDKTYFMLKNSGVSSITNKLSEIINIASS